jgi:outer membrane receptor protein involved in Fe transport
VQYRPFFLATLGLSLLAVAADATTANGPDVLEEVVVTATLRQQTLERAPASVTVLSEQALRDAGRQHFEDVLTTVPNLFWAAGTSRPRYFQIRGIGEREQYEGAPNPSVGFLIDDIDFSGIGMPATLFDVARVEVLRGPQGMRYGANALAGLISVQSAEPQDEFGISTEASVGNYNSESLGAVATGPVEALDSAWRIAVQRYRTDGFRTDSYLHRDDTNDRDELTARAKWRWSPSSSTTVDLTWLHADIDNGYDAWSIDNTRRSLANDPGKDAQRSDGFSLRANMRAGKAADLTVIAAVADSDMDYSFDGDWGNPQSWLPYTYDYFYQSFRNRRTRSLEVRLASSDDSPSTLQWLAGAYVLDMKESLHEISTGEYAEPSGYSTTTDDFLYSNYDATNIALFGELEGQFADAWSWSLGARVEQRDADYHDQGEQGGTPRVTTDSDQDRMWGGAATLSYALSQRQNLYSSLSRSYKAGGFNLGGGALLQQSFDREELTSFEVGMKSRTADSRLYWDVDAFYMWRQDPQVKTGDQLQPSDPNSFVFFTVNAARGTNYGLESSVHWQASRSIELGGSLALLQTSLEGFDYRGTEMPAREQPHAPQYQLALNTTWRHPYGWMARVDFVAIDDFYFDPPPNDQRASAYSLTNIKAGYEGSNWGVYLWSRNVFNEDYVVRGFWFGNQPPLFENKRYVQLGEPRQIGLTARWKF